MNAMLLTLALSLPGQSYVYAAQPVIDLTPAERARCEKALAELRAHRQDQINRMVEDADTRLEWLADRQVALRETLQYESGTDSWGQYAESEVPRTATLELTAAVPEPRNYSLAEFQAKQRLLVQMQKQNRLLASQRKAVFQHQNQVARRHALVAAAGGWVTYGNSDRER